MEKYIPEVQKVMDKQLSIGELGGKMIQRVHLYDNILIVVLETGHWAGTTAEKYNDDAELSAKPLIDVWDLQYAKLISYETYEEQKKYDYERYSVLRKETRRTQYERLKEEFENEH